MVPHQDSSFLHTEPDTCIGLWVALQDARRDNGCLWVLPRSHTAGVAGRFVLQPDRKTAWAAGAPPQYPTLEEGYIPLEVRCSCARE